MIGDDFLFFFFSKIDGERVEVRVRMATNFGHRYKTMMLRRQHRDKPVLLWRRHRNDRSNHFFAIVNFPNFGTDAHAEGQVLPTVSCGLAPMESTIDAMVDVIPWSLQMDIGCKG
jgi:hypothetical protein